MSANLVLTRCPAARPEGLGQHIELWPSRPLLLVLARSEPFLQFSTTISLGYSFVVFGSVIFSLSSRHRLSDPQPTYQRCVRPRARVTRARHPSLRRPLSHLSHLERCALRRSPFLSSSLSPLGAHQHLLPAPVSHATLAASTASAAAAKAPRQRVRSASRTLPLRRSSRARQGSHLSTAATVLFRRAVSAADPAPSEPRMSLPRGKAARSAPRATMARRAAARPRTRVQKATARLVFCPLFISALFFLLCHEQPSCRQRVYKTIRPQDALRGL